MTLLIGDMSIVGRERSGPLFRLGSVVSALCDHGNLARRRRDPPAEVADPLGGRRRDLRGGLRHAAVVRTVFAIIGLGLVVLTAGMTAVGWSWPATGCRCSRFSTRTTSSSQRRRHVAHAARVPPDRVRPVPVRRPHPDRRAAARAVHARQRGPVGLLRVPYTSRTSSCPSGLPRCSGRSRTRSSAATSSCS